MDENEDRHREKEKEREIQKKGKGRVRIMKPGERATSYILFVNLSEDLKPSTTPSFAPSSQANREKKSKKDRKGRTENIQKQATYESRFEAQYLVCQKSKRQRNQCDALVLFLPKDLPGYPPPFLPPLNSGDVTLTLYSILKIEIRDLYEIDALQMFLFVHVLFIRSLCQ